MPILSPHLTRGTFRKRTRRLNDRGADTLFESIRVHERDPHPKPRVWSNLSQNGKETRRSPPANLETCGLSQGEEDLGDPQNHRLNHCSFQTFVSLHTPERFAALAHEVVFAVEQTEPRRIYNSFAWLQSNDQMLLYPTQAPSAIECKFPARVSPVYLELGYF